MCWIGEGPVKIAEKDIIVYKIGKISSDKFQSLYQGYIYNLKELNTEILLSPKIDYGYENSILYIIWKGYHSYKNVVMPFTGLEKNFRAIYGGILQMEMSLPNDYYLGTFIIPKGSKYYENSWGEIVSSNIIYTGKYIKL